MWSLAVLLPAFPGRSRPTTGSPEPWRPWSTNATSGWWPKSSSRSRGRPASRSGPGPARRRGPRSPHRPRSALPCRPTSKPAAGLRTVPAGWPRARGDRLRRGRRPAGTPSDRRPPDRTRRARPAASPHPTGSRRRARRPGRGRADLAGTMHRPRLAPRLQRRRQRGVQADPANGLHQQHPASLRNCPRAVAPDADTRIQPITLAHLRSAALLRTITTLDKSHRPRSAALLALFIKPRTAPLVKARG